MGDNGWENALQGLLKKYEKYSDNPVFLSNEKQVCQTLIVPFVKYVLGWDTDDYSEFRVEEGQMGKRIDYVVYDRGISQFVIEAKAADKNIFENRQYYEQALEYAFGKEKDFAILTNFKQFVILSPNIRYRFPEQAELVKINLLDASDDDLALLREFSKKQWRESSSSGELHKLLVKKMSGKKQIPIDEHLLEDMKKWREQLLRSVKKNNPKLEWEDSREFMHIEEEVQKFIDRLVFICFCEDKQLKEPKLKSLLLTKQDRYHMSPGWLLKKIHALFDDYNQEYNSDLFDSSLADRLKIDDAKIMIVLEDLRKPKDRPAYNFASIERDILGKVYENFIGHMQTGKKRFKEKEDKGKRKKEGIYYTPKYIVDYIVNNTVREYVKDLSYEEMLKVRVLDPACGSGSFLIRAYDVLLEEATDKLDRPPNYKERKEIMLNCIYGVDLDKRAVEIAKLNLSLRMADRDPEEKRQKLPMLSENIRHGNSLIDDADVAGWHAFEWEKEFKQIMDDGGFDVVIGNPPYVRIQTIDKKDTEFFKKEYKAAVKGNYDIYVLFVEKGVEILNSDGRLGFILPHKFFNAKYGVGLRDVVSEGNHLSQIVHFGDQQVFDGATTYTCLLFLDKEGNDEFNFHKVDDLEEWRQSEESESGKVAAKQATKDEWNFIIGPAANVFEKLDQMPTRLGDVAERIFQGLKTGADKVFILDVKEEGYYSSALGKNIALEDTYLKPLFKSGEMKKYVLLDNTRVIIFPYEKGEIVPFDRIQDSAPKTAEYLVQCKKILEGRERGRFKGKDWHCYSRNQALQIISSKKILTADLNPFASFCVDCSGDAFFPGGAAGGYGILPPENFNIYYLLALLNSNVLDFYVRNISTEFRGGWYSFEARVIRNLPICTDVSEEDGKNNQDKIVAFVDKMLNLYRQLQESNEDSSKAKKIQRKIDGVDEEINNLIYDLYNITKKERKIIEETLND